MKSLICVVLLATAYRVLSTTLTRVRSESVSSERRVVCYYGSWSVYRPDLGKFDVEDIDPYVCNVVIYAFAGLNSSNYEIQSLDPYNDLYENGGKGAFERFTKLSETNPDLKCMLGIGGWNEGSQKYSDMANNSSRRAHFVETVVPFLKQYGFHGLDMDWEYPTQRGGIPSDRDAYTKLLKKLHEAFAPEGLLLSALVSADKDTIDAAYDVPEMVKYLDFINLMTYEFHGAWTNGTEINAPIYANPADSLYEQTMTVNFSVNYWLQLGAPASKINLGMPSYGRDYTLSNVSNHGIHAPTNGPGQAGPYTRQAGSLGYNEICMMLQDGGWEVVVDPYYLVPYAYKGNQWIGYDDPESIAQKCELANDLNLGGGMIWSIETDDFQPTCGPTPFPLLAVINEYIRGIYSNSTHPPTPPPPTTTPYTGPPTPAPTSKAPIPPPPPSDVCKYPGYQADPNDCTIYYECVPTPSGTWDIYTFHCNQGTVFDPAIDSCNYPDAVPDCHAKI